MQHFADRLEKKLVGECAEERSYNSCTEEIFRLTGRHVTYLDHNVMRRDLSVLRQKHAATQEQTDECQARRTQAFIAKFETESDHRLRQFAVEWTELMEMEKQHTVSCTETSVQCRGCLKSVCTHLGNYICSSVPVCTWCDTRGQPNPFNPKNRSTLLPKTKLAENLCREIDGKIKDTISETHITASDNI